MSGSKIFCPRCGKINDGEAEVCVSCKFNLAIPEKSQSQATYTPTSESHLEPTITSRKEYEESLKGAEEWAKSRKASNPMINLPNKESGKQCNNCGHVRTKTDDEFGMASANACPKCLLPYYGNQQNSPSGKRDQNQKKTRQERILPADTSLPASTIREEVAYAGNRDSLDTPSKSFSLNQNPKRILIAVIAVIVAMIAYPPFQVVGNKGLVLNMGYGWIFDPPVRGYIRATVNTSMLLIQWIGILVVGGIAFFLIKGASVSSGPSWQQTTARTSPIEKPKESNKFFGGVHHPWRRFFARMVDESTLGLFATFVVAFVIGLILPDKAEGLAKALSNQIIAGFIVLVLWMPIESVLLSTVGNTPGKWLFGILVRTTSGHKPSFNQALERSFRVLLQGLGLGIPPVPLFTQLFAYRRLTKTGTTLWDTATECVVTHKTWGTARTIVCVAAVLLVFVFMALLNLTEKKDDSDPRTKGVEGISDRELMNAWDKAGQSTPEAPAPAPAPVPVTAEDWYAKAKTLLIGGSKFSDPQKAIEYLNEVIRLRPVFVAAYNYRGHAYADLELYQQAIEDFNQVIRLEPDRYMAYISRGYAYLGLKLYQQAIEDFNQVIRLKPNEFVAYSSRGHAYADLELYQQAIEDFNQVIRLKPDWSSAYSSRGFAYILSGNSGEGCRSLIRACELGYCKGYELAKQQGHCR